MRNFDMNNFDKILENSFSDAPPEEIQNKVIPWNKPLRYISFGFFITMLPLETSFINLFITVFGLTLMMLGFRILRAENKYFLACWILSILRILLLYPNAIANATIYGDTFTLNLPIQIIISTVSVIATLALYSCAYKGLQCITKKLEVNAYLRDNRDLLGWFLLALVIFVIPSITSFATLRRLSSLLFMLIACGGIFINFYRMLRFYKTSGYLVKTAKIRFPDWTVVLAICGTLLFGIGCGYLFVDDFEEIYCERDNAAYQELYDLKETLHEKGLAKDLLNSFSAEDLAVLGTAEEIVYWNDDSNFRTNWLHIAAKLPGETETWKIYHCLRDIQLTGSNCIDAIELRTPDQLSPETWQLVGEISGNISGNTTGHRAYSKIETVTYEKTGWFDDPREVTSTFFSFESNSMHFGAYLSYQVTALQEDATLNTEITYIHQTTWMQYPVKTPVAAYTENSGRPTDVFQTLTKTFELDTSEY